MSFDLLLEAAAASRGIAVRAGARARREGHEPGAVRRGGHDGGEVGRGRGARSAEAEPAGLHMEGGPCAGDTVGEFPTCLYIGCNAQQNDAQ